MTIKTIRSADDCHRFRRRRSLEWARSAQYWLSQPLRHVVDIGGAVGSRVSKLCADAPAEIAQVVDMGCGEAWLLRELRTHGVKHRYLGLDSSPAFLEHCRLHYGSVDASFELADFEETLEATERADVVVNAFNFFELCHLGRAFQNAAGFLKVGGTLLLATIDKSYLILAISRDWEELHANLRRYAELPGTKYAFQPIDLGTGVSESLYYPSVLYSTEDYLTAGALAGLSLQSFEEFSFTHAVVPKIYNVMQFVKNQPGGAVHATL